MDEVQDVLTQKTEALESIVEEKKEDDITAVVTIVVEDPAN